MIVGGSCSQGHVESGQKVPCLALTVQALSSNYDTYRLKTRRVLDEDEIPVRLRAGAIAFDSNRDSGGRLARPSSRGAARGRSLPRHSAGAHTSRSHTHHSPSQAAPRSPTSN